MTRCQGTRLQRVMSDGHRTGSPSLQQVALVPSLKNSRDSLDGQCPGVPDENGWTSGYKRKDGTSEPRKNQKAWSLVVQKQRKESHCPCQELNLKLENYSTHSTEPS